MPSVEERLQAIEDRLAIYNVISAYGPTVDGCNLEDMGRVYAEHGIYDVRDFQYMDGLADIRAMMNSVGHRTLTGHGAAHIGSLPHVELEGDRAIATNYNLIYGRKDGEPVLLRLSISRIYLSRGSQGWRIDRRIIDPLDGRASSRDLAARAFEGPDQDPGARADALSLNRGERGTWDSYGEALARSSLTPPVNPGDI
ncbi:nuclear transport factor 2 family protein [Novosphingobium bradum]|uniref:Nuclear transport factor 2 family protein n=1 Tax=Novosphingobium bradum TaxID=1737444 RepID=A0ABV7IJ37_9SPHN